MAQTSLVVEQAHVCHCHCDAVFVAGVNDIVVANGTTGLGYELHPTLVGALNVVTEGEESI